MSLWKGGPWASERQRGGEILSLGPGPQTLAAGDINAGWFGEVSADDLFFGDGLALMLGVTQGVLQNSDAGWLKFARHGKVLFVAKRSFVHSVSWDHLYSRGIVYGVDGDGPYPRGTPTNQMTIVERGGNQFIVRLLTGAHANPFDDSDDRYLTDDMHELNIGAGSEWNELVYRVHEAVPSEPGIDGMRADRHGGPQEGSNWAEFSNSELNIGTGNGRQSWCQETSTSDSSVRVGRGFDHVAYFFRLTASSTSSTRGWRPCLELIPNY